MQHKTTILALLLSCVIYAQDEPKTSPFKGCKAEDECFNERFREWLSDVAGDIEKYKGQKAVIELQKQQRP